MYSLAGVILGGLFVGMLTPNNMNVNPTGTYGNSSILAGGGYGSNVFPNGMYLNSYQGQGTGCKNGMQRGMGMHR